MSKYRIDGAESLFLFIDQQPKLLNSLYQQETILKNAMILAQIAHTLKIEALITTQYKKGLGEVAKEIAVFNFPAYDKTSFSIWQDHSIQQAIKASDKKQLIISGGETHICIYQSVRDLLQEDYEIFLVADAISSRSQFAWKNGLKHLKSLGANLVTTELVLFDLLGDAKHPHFKELQNLIK